MVKTMLHSSLRKAEKETINLNLPEDKDVTMSQMPSDFLIDENFNIV